MGGVKVQQTIIQWNSWVRPHAMRGLGSRHPTLVNREKGSCAAWLGLVEGNNRNDKISVEHPYK